MCVFDKNKPAAQAADADPSQQVIRLSRWAEPRVKVWLPEGPPVGKVSRQSLWSCSMEKQWVWTCSSLTELNPDFCGWGNKSGDSLILGLDWCNKGIMALPRSLRGLLLLPPVVTNSFDFLLWTLINIFWQYLILLIRRRGEKSSQCCSPWPGGRQEAGIEYLE